MSSNSLALLDAQLDGIAVVLKEAAARIEAARVAAAQAVKQETTPAKQSTEQAAEHDADRDDPNRIVPLSEASRLSSLSIDTLRRRHRSRFIRLSERRWGMRKRDALMLSG